VKKLLVEEDNHERSEPLEKRFATENPLKQGSPLRSRNIKKAVGLNHPSKPVESVRVTVIGTLGFSLI
jgi:hypothetical protein